MGFKARILGETLILCVLLILDTRNIVSGCKLFNPDETEVPLDSPETNFAMVGIFADNQTPGLLATFGTADVTSVSAVSGPDGKYLDYSFEDTSLKILFNNDYTDWEKNEDEYYWLPSVILQLQCSDKTVDVEFRAQITPFTNNYQPVFSQSSYEITLPMPLPAGYTIYGECDQTVEVTDYDYNSQYKSDIAFKLEGTTTGLAVTSSKTDGKKWAMILKTTNTFKITEPLIVTVIAEDVPPTGKQDDVLSNEVTITIIPDIDNSTPESPVFGEPIYILDIQQEENVGSVQASLVEGATPEFVVELVHLTGEDLSDFFDTAINGAVVTLTPQRPLTDTEISGNFGVLILVAKHPNTDRIGKTVIHVTLPGNYVTPPPTNTSSTTTPTTTTPTTTTPTTITPTTTTTTTPTTTTTTTPTTTTTTTGIPGSSAAPPLEKYIRFTEPNAAVYIYAEVKGYIKTMSAYCFPNRDCNIKYEIKPGRLSDSLVIDQKNGNINITKGISDSDHFDVKASAQIDGEYYETTATVQLNVKTLQPCPNGSYWSNAITVMNIKEGFEPPLTLEKCDSPEGHKCAIEKVIPEKARDYFSDGGEVALTKAIHREDGLFPDQSNPYIILHVALSGEGDEQTINKFWNKRSRSVIDDIGTIKYNQTMTVIVLRIDYIDKRPEFNIPSLTVGYPNAELANQLLPPYLMKAQATDIDSGENAMIRYSLTPADSFFIHPDTGVIYPVANEFRYEDTQFKVYASDSLGEGEPLGINVTILIPDNLLVIKQSGSVLEDVDAVIDEISSITSFNIKLLSAAVIASATVANNAAKKKDYRQLPNFKSVNDSSNSLLQLIVYGLGTDEKPVSYSEIKEKLDKVTDYKTESWAASQITTVDESTDIGMLITVIVLAVVILLLLVGTGVVYLLYTRSKRKNDEDYYDSMLNRNGRSSATEVDKNASSPDVKDESDRAPAMFSHDTEVKQPSPPTSPHLSTTKLEQELVNKIEPDEFKKDTADLNNTASHGDDGEHQEEKKIENVKKRKKSLVTFNDNVERIELEEV